MNSKIVAIVGMTGSGKTETAKLFADRDFVRIRFGDITDKEVEKRGLELNEENERLVRELLRKEQGNDAYAKLNLTLIDTAAAKSDVVIDGLYSWEEYKFLKAHYGDNFVVVAVFASPKTRYTRLSARKERGLNHGDAAGRDKAEIENINKGGPIAMADYAIINESFLNDLEKEVIKIVLWLRE